MREPEDINELTPDRLRYLAQGCTELTCLYHGAYNRRLVELGERRGQ